MGQNSLWWIQALQSGSIQLNKLANSQRQERRKTHTRRNISMTIRHGTLLASIFFADSRTELELNGRPATNAKTPCGWYGSCRRQEGTVIGGKHSLSGYMSLLRPAVWWLPSSTTQYLPGCRSHPMTSRPNDCANNSTGLAVHQEV